MERFPGYTVLRTEDCPEQHGTLTVLTHDVSGATVLLVEMKMSTRRSASASAPFRPTTPACSTFWNTRCWRAAKIPGHFAVPAAAEKQHGVLPERDDLPG